MKTKILEQNNLQGGGGGGRRTAKIDIQDDFAGWRIKP